MYLALLGVLNFTWCFFFSLFFWITGQTSTMWHWKCDMDSSIFCSHTQLYPGIFSVWGSYVWGSRSQYFGRVSQQLTPLDLIKLLRIFLCTVNMKLLGKVNSPLMQEAWCDVGLLNSHPTSVWPIHMRLLSQVNIWSLPLVCSYVIK